MKLTVLTESNEQFTASVEAWVLGIYKALDPAQKRRVLEEVEKIDQQFVRMKVPRHGIIGVPSINGAEIFGAIGGRG